MRTYLFIKVGVSDTIPVDAIAASIVGVLVCNDGVALTREQRYKLAVRGIVAHEWQAAYASHDGRLNQSMDILLETSTLGHHKISTQG